jgi:putative component of membrane protein insertase Oxa1/YidC/SpoIIIJ protein YidD
MIGSRALLRAIQWERQRRPDLPGAVCHLRPSCGLYGRQEAKRRGVLAVPAILARLVRCEVTTRKRAKGR